MEKVSNRTCKLKQKKKNYNSQHLGVYFLFEFGWPNKAYKLQSKMWTK